MPRGKSKARILESGRIALCAWQSAQIALCITAFAWWKPWPELSSAKTGSRTIASSTHSIARRRNTFGPTMATTGLRSTFGRRHPRTLSFGRKTRLGRALLLMRNLNATSVQTLKLWRCSSSTSTPNGRTLSRCGDPWFTKRSPHRMRWLMNSCPSTNSGLWISATCSALLENQQWQQQALRLLLTTRGNAVLIDSIRMPLILPRRGTSRAGGTSPC